MTLPERAARLRSRIACERGLAIPVVMTVLFVVGLVVMAAAARTVTSASQSTRDASSKRALEVASAGVDVAIWRLNVMAPSDAECVDVLDPATANLTVGPADASSPPGPGGAAHGWCRTVASGDGAAVDDRGSFNYRVSTTYARANGDAQRSIVSTGTVNGVEKRIVQAVKTKQDASVFGPWAAVAMDPDPNSEFSTASGSHIFEDCARSTDGRCEALVFSHGRVRHGGSELCGRAYDRDGLIEISNASYNVAAKCPAGYQTDNPGPATASISTPYTTAKADELPDPTRVPPISSTIDNCRINGAMIVDGNPCGDGRARAWFDAPAGPDSTVWSSSTGSPVKDTLILKNNAKLHLPGGDYSLCFLSLEKNSKLYIETDGPTKNTVRIFLKRPEDCGTAPMPPGMTNSAATWGSFYVGSQNAALVNNATDPGDPNVTSLQFWIQGSATRPTYFHSGGNLGSHGETLVGTVFAPRSTIDLRDSGDWTGAVVGKTISLGNSFTLKYDDSAKDLKIPLAFVRAAGYAECSAKPPVATPDSGCDEN